VKAESVALIPECAECDARRVALFKSRNTLCAASDGEIIVSVAALGEVGP
jgi:hypothetical protein